MKAYRFETTVSKEGTIRIPPNAKLIDQEVEVILFPKHPKSNKKITADEFVDQWAGFLQNTDPDALKFDYLSEKYQ